MRISKHVRHIEMRGLRTCEELHHGVTAKDIPGDVVGYADELVTRTSLILVTRAIPTENSEKCRIKRSAPLRAGITIGVPTKQCNPTKHP